MPQSRMDSATRVMRARTPDSRSGVPTRPWRYLEATMLVAVMDQSAGTSTFFCSKMSLPFQSWMMASRSSQVISSKGEMPGLVKWRVKRRPGALPPLFLVGGGGGDSGGGGSGKRFGHCGETFQVRSRVTGRGLGGGGRRRGCGRGVRLLPEKLRDEGHRDCPSGDPRPAH